MMRNLLLSLLLLIAVPLAAQQADPLPSTEANETAEAFPWTGTVTATTLNVRANPGLRYEVVAKLNQDDPVTIVQRDDEWLGILPPAETEVWLAAQHVAEGRATENTQIYSGPGIYFSTMGKVREGQPITVIRTKNGMWSLIEPPQTAVVWVHSDYIQPLTPPEPEPVPEPPPEPEPDPEPEPPATAEHHVDPLPPAADDASHERVGIPESVAAVGYVVPLGTAEGPWTYALAHKVDDTYYPYLYLDKHTPNLQSWQWRRVLMRGTRQWLNGWPRPLLKVDTIQSVDDE